MWVPVSAPPSEAVLRANFTLTVQVEAYYFSAAAGHKRILGNRRFGENGFISSGRMQARPVAQSSRSSKVLPCFRSGLQVACLYDNFSLYMMFCRCKA